MEDEPNGKKASRIPQSIRLAHDLLYLGVSIPLERRTQLFWPLSPAPSSEAQSAFLHQWASTAGAPLPPCWLGHRRSPGPRVRFHWFLHKSLPVTHTLLPCPATLNILPPAISAMGSNGNRNTCFPGLMLLTCPWNWGLNGKQTFLYTAEGPFKVPTQNEFVRKNHEPTRCWQCDDVLCKYTGAMLLSFFLLEKSASPWPNCRVLSETLGTLPDRHLLIPCVLCEYGGDRSQKTFQSSLRYLQTQRRHRRPRCTSLWGYDKEKAGNTERQSVPLFGKQTSHRWTKDYEIMLCDKATAFPKGLPRSKARCDHLSYPMTQTVECGEHILWLASGQITAPDFLMYTRVCLSQAVPKSSKQVDTGVFRNTSRSLSIQKTSVDLVEVWPGPMIWPLRREISEFTGGYNYDLASWWSPRT